MRSKTTPGYKSSDFPLYSLVALIDALGIGALDVLGHSFGGFLAQEVTPWTLFHGRPSGSVPIPYLKSVSLIILTQS